MASGFSAWTSLRPHLLSALRVMTGLLFLQHGTTKFLSFPLSPMSGGTDAMTLTTGALELVGGALIVVGLFTRPVAFILSGFMAVAYFMAHAAWDNFFPLLNGGELAIMYCFAFLYLSAAGGGPWSLDAIVRKKG